MRGPLSGIYEIKDGIKSKRVSSYDRNGGNGDWIVIQPGETAQLALIPGAGIIKHIWITLMAADPFIRRNAVIRMYWDQEEHPSVEAPLGDFFGQGWGEEYNFTSLPLAAAPAQGKALNCYFPMPFGNGASITLENQSEQLIERFYYYVDYEEHAAVPDTMGRFHAFWNKELTESHPEEGETEWGIVGPQGSNRTDERNYLFADIAGKGHFVGVNYYVDNPGPMWYGEGDDMWLIDDEAWPGSLHGTGTEDFFNTSWCPNELYSHPYFGIAKIPASKLGWMGRTHCYRFFLEDPIYFERSLRASIEHGHDNALTLDICSVAYWYQMDPHKVFPIMRSKALRGNMPEIGPVDVHRWRHEWRNARGAGKTLWGNET
ncbi:glycoside hydrolase family 172 protein [Bacillus sp. FJAT-28004]|uniref:glycoside hydrolase family 172 protein n=1 Tax=Bacillus sp. FJAT-28004 TaxID=1679165 RepID=UPI0006B5CFCD|nr:glycoside hydrolase family 172 protein [Bacillus sp. FJAT-28004]